MSHSNKNVNSGYIYCLINEGMPDLVKVGRTNNLEERIKQSNKTDTFKSPYSFKCIYAIKVTDTSVEKLFHLSLDKYRITREETNGQSEYFKISSDAIYSLFNMYLKMNNNYKCSWVYNNYIKVERPTVRCAYRYTCIICNCNIKNHEITHKITEIIQKQSENIVKLRSTPKIFFEKNKETNDDIDKLFVILEQKCTSEVDLDE